LRRLFSFHKKQLPPGNNPSSNDRLKSISRIN
jgi:hypothetical protein